MKNLVWVQLTIGLWILVSPWLLGFSQFGWALWNNIFAGAAIFVISLWLVYGRDEENKQENKNTDIPPTDGENIN